MFSIRTSYLDTTSFCWFWLVIVSLSSYYLQNKVETNSNKREMFFLITCSSFVTKPAPKLAYVILPQDDPHPMTCPRVVRAVVAGTAVGLLWKRGCRTPPVITKSKFLGVLVPILLFTFTSKRLPTKVSLG